MSKPKNNVTDLLAKIKRQTPEPPEEMAAAAPPVKSRTGSPVQFWLYDEDRRIIRELYGWLANQGVRPNDSLVMRTALRVAKPGASLLAAYRETCAQDRRVKP